LLKGWLLRERSKMSLNVFVYGNHSCSNRGDLAIARGLIDWIRGYQPEAVITLYTRFPGSAELFLGDSANIERDPLEKFYAERRGKLDLIRKALLKRFLALYLALGLWKIFGLTKAHKKFLIDLKECDLFVQVGGSFFVDVYSIGQFEGMLLARIAGVPVICCGHSVGPFTGGLFRYVARRAFDNGAMWLLRENESLKLMEKAGIPTDSIRESGDTAWLLPVSSPPPDVPTTQDRPFVAMTVRQLAPFDRVLGLSQEKYENEVAHVADGLVERGFMVCFVSTCTGLEGYWRDDRMVALRIQRAMEQHEYSKVIMDEWSDLELGAFMGSCRLVVATRLHSAILSMRFGTPAIVLGYEHKSAGVCQRLGVEELNYPLELGINADQLLSGIDSVIAAEDDYRQRITKGVQAEIELIESVHAEILGPYLRKERPRG